MCAISGIIRTSPYQKGEQSGVEIKLIKNVNFQNFSIKSFPWKAILICIHNICFYGELMVLKKKTTLI